MRFQVSSGLSFFGVGVTLNHCVLPGSGVGEVFFCLSNPLVLTVSPSLRSSEVVGPWGSRGQEQAAKEERAVGAREYVSPRTRAVSPSFPAALQLYFAGLPALALHQFLERFKFV